MRWVLVARCPRARLPRTRPGVFGKTYLNPSATATLEQLTCMLIVSSKHACQLLHVIMARNKRTVIFAGPFLVHFRWNHTWLNPCWSVSNGIATEQVHVFVSLRFHYVFIHTGDPLRFQKPYNYCGFPYILNEFQALRFHYVFKSLRFAIISEKSLLFLCILMHYVFITFSNHYVLLRFGLIQLCSSKS